MDIIFFAVIALLLIWKLRSVLSKDQSFLSKTTDAYAPYTTTQEAPQSNGVAILQAIGISNKNKPTKESIDAILSFEKMQIDQSLHNIYQSIFEMNYQVTISSTAEIAKQMYEELFYSFKTKNLNFSFIVAPELSSLLSEKITRINHSISLQKIDSSRIVDISLFGKDALFVVEIKSQQIVYKEDENHSVVDGSKSIAVPATEYLHIIRQISNAEGLLLKDIKA